MHSYDATLKALFQKGRFQEKLLGAPVAEFLAVEFQNVQQRRPDLVAGRLTIEPRIWNC